MVSRKSRRKKKRSKSKTSLKKSTSMHRNVGKKLKRVLSHLRNESSCSTQNTSVIDLDESLPRKRKRDSELETQRTAKRSHNDSSCIIITDVDTKAGTSGQTKTPNKTKVTTEPLDSSTPLSKPKLDTSNNCLNISNLQRPNRNLTDSLRRDIDELTQDIINESLYTVDLTTGTANNTIDLTNDTLNSTDGGNNTVIDLDSSVADNNADCTLVSVSDGNVSLSLSGESQVTVIQNTKRKKEKRMQRFANGIANMNASEKGRLLELITEKILGGAELSTTTSQSILRHRPKVDRASDTAEDTFIKEVILGQVLSRKNSIGSNIYNPQKEIKEKSGLRMVVIDGSNVAMEHEKGRQFSVKGLKICIDYFVKRGHIVKAFVPRFRCKFGKSTDPRLLDSLERQGLVVYTPSREVQGKFITSYDDRYIIQCAAEFDGVIVSGDNYRDLLGENPRWRHIIENRLLQFTWVGDMIMFPKDPLGRFGPTLEQLLKHGGSR